jgi:hypothetical protein
MVEVNRYGTTSLYTKAIGLTIGQTGTEDSFMRMEMCIRASGKMIKLMEKESILKMMAQTIQANGSRIYNMDLEYKNGLMDRLTKGMIYVNIESISKALNKEKGNLFGLMDLSTKETLKII